MKTKDLKLGDSLIKYGVYRNVDTVYKVIKVKGNKVFLKYFKIPEKEYFDRLLTLDYTESRELASTVKFIRDTEINELQVIIAKVFLW